MYSKVGQSSGPSQKVGQLSTNTQRVGQMVTHPNKTIKTTNPGNIQIQGQISQYNKYK